jgi:two-component system sensor kinase FixL
MNKPRRQKRRPRPLPSLARKTKPLRPRQPSDVRRTLEQAHLLNISQDAIFCWRQPGGIEFWNEGATALYGYSEHEVLGKSSHKLLNTRFPDSLVNLSDELRARGAWEGELHQRTRDGREIAVFARFQVLPRKDRGMLVLESARDITELKKNQAMLERRLREQAVTARFSVDALKATNIQSICDDATDILTREIGAGLSSLWELSREGTRLHLRSGTGWSPGHVGIAEIEADEKTPAGRAVYLERTVVIENARADRLLRLPDFMRRHKIASSVAAVIQGRGDPFGALVMSRVTPHVFAGDEIRFIESIANVLATAIARIQFENELREASARLKGVVDTAVDGIITISEEGIVETMNPAAERIFGYDALEVVGRNISMLMPEPYRSEHDDYLERYRRTGERRIIGIGREVRGRRKDGSEFPMDLAVSVINFGNRRIFTGIVRDITARKELEQEILAISDHEQRRIGADLHDDLCQRLAGIRFACDSLRKTLGDSSDERALERLGKIGAEISAAIDHTRMLARGMTPVALEQNGLASALEELAASVRKLFHVKCTFRASKTIAINDPIAATHLYRIAQEAINNALKHGCATAITLSLGRNGSNSLLRIGDNGTGFSMKDSREAEGMGLRTIAYRAAMISGSTRVVSFPGRGTTITCQFPANL